MNHWKPVKHLWKHNFFWGLKSTSAFCSEDIFFQAANQKNQQAPRLGNCWSRKRPSGTLNANASKPADDTRATGGLGELWEYEIHQGGWGFWHMKLGELLKDLGRVRNLGELREILGNWDLCEFRAMINTKNPKGSCSYWVGAPVPNSVGPQGGIFQPPWQKTWGQPH